MSDAGEQAHRSSSPLKRRASSMEPAEQDITDAARDDVDMLMLPPESDGEADGGLNGAPKEEQDSPRSDHVPPIFEQIKTIETLVKAFAETPLQEGTQVYLVSRRWLKKAQDLGADGKHSATATTLVELGPVDNADIIQTIFKADNGEEVVKLKPGMGSENFELFPKDAWELMLSWYGLALGQIPIIRTAHNTSPDPMALPNIQVEYHPPIFTIYRVWSALSPLAIDRRLKQDKPAPAVIASSSSAHFMSFLKTAKQLTDIPMERKVRVWKVIHTLPTIETQDDPSGIKTPPESPEGGASSTVSRDLPIPQGSWPEMLLDVETFLKLEKDTQRSLLEDAQDRTFDANYNGKKSLALVDLMVDHVLVLDEEVTKDAFVTTYSGVLSKEKTLATRGSTSNLSAPMRTTASGRASPAPSGPITRGRSQQKSGRVIGTTGLQNLGNTCYMNSALQCLRSVEELTKYFLTHESHKEINRENPLSHNGDVAAVYGKLLEDLYKDPPLNAVAPRSFKNIIGKYASSFSGYGQQDSQEFLGWLLDALQEDLSRIKKKPYIEKPDSTDDMINNHAAIREMAEKVWDITKKRDDSVIADLFTGMYKSTLVCPECSKISITFDPFNNLTLPLPVPNVWTHSVKYFPLNDTPVEIAVDIDKNSSIKALKHFISQRVGVPVQRIVGGEEFKDKFFKYYEDFSSVSDEITASDHPVFFEVEAEPTNLSALKKTKKKTGYRSLLDTSDQEEAPTWEDPMAERLLVPVLHRVNAEDNIRKRGRNRGDGDVPPPHFIILTPEEARSEDIIRRKVLEKVATWTTYPKLAEEDGEDSEETTDPELINTSSDADSSGDPKVIAKSVEGEEDIVDVSMRASANMKNPGAAESRNEYPGLLKKFKSKRPRWINPHEFLEPEFQNLFELSWFRDPGSHLPTGWQNISDSPNNRLSTRQPRPIMSDVEMRSPGRWDGSDDSGSDETGQVSASVMTRMASESDESTEEFPHAPQHHNPTRLPGPNMRNQVSVNGKKKMKPGRTYGKKGKKRLEKQQRNARQPPRQQQAATPELDDTGYDGGPLIRLGEGLVVDWNEAAMENLFDGPLGRRTWSNLSTLEDPALDEMRKKRLQRKRNGITLDDCLEEFEREEILSEQDTWFCPRCKEHRRASKKFDLWKTPDILIVHLKRFSSSGYRRDKIDIMVDFPVEGLDLTQRVIDQEDGKEEIYDLIAVDDHWGGLGGGHYTAFAKNFVNGAWYEYNDASVSKETNLKRIVGSAAYLLFYRRRSAVPLGGPRFQKIFERFDSTNSDDDEMSESGEGQRLGQGSSLRGSPSASAGADLVLHHGNRELATSTTVSSFGQATSDDNVILPQYGPAIPNGHLTAAAATGDDGADLWNESGQDDDEAIDLPEYSNSGLSNTMAGAFQLNHTEPWNFDNLGQQTGSDADDVGSNVAQNDIDSDVHDFADNFNSADASMTLDGHHEGDDLLPMASEPGDDYLEPREPLQPEMDDEFIPPPANLELMSQLQFDAWDKRIEHVPPTDLKPDDDVAEIHVEEPDAEAVPGVHHQEDAAGEA